MLSCNSIDGNRESDTTENKTEFNGAAIALLSTSKHSLSKEKAGSGECICS